MVTPLEKVRIARGYSKVDVARAVGCDKSHYGNIEAAVRKPNGKIHKPSPELAQKLVEYFAHEITLQQLLFVEQYVNVETPVAA